MIKHSIFATTLLLILFLSVICQAEPLTRRFIVELQQTTDSPANQSFSVRQCDLRTFSGIADTNSYAGSASLPDGKLRRSYGYGVKTTLIESISWQLLYVTHLLVDYKLILSIKDTPKRAIPHPSPPVEAIIVVGWLLKSYWNQDLPSLNPVEKQIEQQEAAPKLTQKGQPFAIITMGLGSGQKQQGQLSESSDQQASGATIQLTGIFTSPRHSGSGGGNGDSEQHPHTLGLNCFVNSCNGVCIFRHSLDSDRHAYDQNNASLETESTGLQEKTISLTFPHFHSQAGTSNTQRTCPATMIREDGRRWPCGRICKSAQSLRDHRRRDHSGLQTCLLAVVGEDAQQQTCGRVCKSSKALSDHKRKDHSGIQTCNLTVIGKDGLSRPCGTVCKNAQSLTDHKRRYHTGQQTCHLTVVGVDSQQRPCGKVCMSTKALSDHKRKDHSGKQTCQATVIGKDGLSRPCGTVCKNAQSLSSHKSRNHNGQKTCKTSVAGEDDQPKPCGKILDTRKTMWNDKRKNHSGQKTCKVTVVGEDGLQRPCGKNCMNAQTLLIHKRKEHSRQQTCHMIMVREGSQPSPCGVVLKNAHSMSSHKCKYHTGRVICDVTVVGEDGQQRPCGMVCKSKRILTDHRRTHLKRKFNDLDQNNVPSP
ncbi:MULTISPECIES: hypothetical protein [unclassified Endozoicomonas]|uniref:hypothetical protein n=1 Tax=unclassified Endozoicomonas TaxID=2644528 RepID=UPI002148AEAD|nr:MULTISPECIES: hypothetical protein [unclassified Endozoicomonas]